MENPDRMPKSWGFWLRGRSYFWIQGLGLALYKWAQHKSIMKKIFAILTVFVVASLCATRAADGTGAAKVPLAALQAADDARVAAMKSGNREKLGTIFSDELHYAHSTGEVDTKASFIDKLTSGRTKYELMEYEKRDFTAPTPGMALMTGRVHIRAVTGENITDSVLSFLAVWRLEKGEWRFLAWQSCKLPPK